MRSNDTSRGPHTVLKQLSKYDLYSKSDQPSAGKGLRSRYEDRAAERFAEKIVW